MKFTSPTIEQMIEILSALPTIGKKSALRLTLFLLRQPDEFVQKFAETLLKLKENVKFCSICFNFTETDPCPICSDDGRQKDLICVVENPDDVLAIEKTNEYKGVYHVLHGTINHLNGISISKLKINELVERAKNAKEIIFALNPSVESEVTTHYIVNLLKDFPVKLTRIARGLPVGIEIQYADDATLLNAIENRTEIK
ncbi:recombination protein RecR [Bacteroidetes/Chlorobi group bacterium Naka2016]|jgi:recombination protein RecR|nr:MAG: recombination protein RecR [Bacteroidetes/Chlorobi group bacterium Naka2016]